KKKKKKRHTTLTTKTCWISSFSLHPSLKHFPRLIDRSHCPSSLIVFFFIHLCNNFFLTFPSFFCCHTPF
ncbi:hypothetical protein L873DRAFT_1737952, partial [Choiromyces venosus 120613-1]